MEPSEPFNITDEKGDSIERKLLPDAMLDCAIFWNGRYIDCNETRNGYYESDGKVIPVDHKLFSERQRHLGKYAYIIVPRGTATAVMMDRTPTERFLGRIVESGKIENDSLRQYMDETRGHHSSEITMYN